jgi:hypothetical protein
MVIGGARVWTVAKMRGTAKSGGRAIKKRGASVFGRRLPLPYAFSVQSPSLVALRQVINSRHQPSAVLPPFSDWPRPARC